MKKSIFQSDSVRDQGDYDMINVESFVQFLDELGYSPENKKSYKEQGYYLKTVIRDTAYHGQFRLNFHKDNEAIGLVLFSSHDTQLPFSLYAGLKLNNGDVLPMIELLSVKHIKSQIDRIDAELLAFNIENSVKRLTSELNSWNEVKVGRNEIFSTFSKVNDYKASIIKNALAMTPVICENKYQLFGFLISGSIYGRLPSESGRKIKEIKHLRRHIQLTKFITELLSK